MLPNTLTSSPPASAALLSFAPAEPTVRVSGYAYVIDMERGACSHPHTVHKDRTCTCGDPACPAINLVADWLKAGRIERAPDPPAGYTAFLPRSCPVCGEPVFCDHSLSSRTRGLGWRCVQGGARHYWQHKWQALRDWFFREELLPAILRRGDLIAGAPMGYLPEANRSCQMPAVAP